MQNAKDRLLPGVQNVIPVASGKGGVGKSTLAANLALALAEGGAKVGLMDADVYGPSIPTILGVRQGPHEENGRLLPAEKYGVKVISMGFFVGPNEAVIWRGPMLHKMVQDFLGTVEWGQLDHLLVDLPPGTGDIQLSLCQTIPVTGAVIVSTPQDVAWRVAQKAIVMFDKLSAPVLGIVENMSRYVCPHCGHPEEIFGTGGAERAARALGIAYLGGVPLETSIRKTADQGDPVVHSFPKSASAEAFRGLARNLLRQLEIQRQAPAKVFPVKFGAPGGPTVDIEWSDGLKSSHPARELRRLCPCAACVDEVTGQRRIRLEEIPQEATARAFHPVGRYAVQIVWSDGHATGLYGYDTLRKTNDVAVKR